MDRSSAEYKQQLRSCLRWDPESKEAYLQLPSYPDLRLSPMRSGSADGLVSSILPYQSPRAGKLIRDRLHCSIVLKLGNVSSDCHTRKSDVPLQS
jgi:hypothetical protein